MDCSQCRKGWGSSQETCRECKAQETEREQHEKRVQRGILYHPDKALDRMFYPSVWDDVNERV